MVTREALADARALAGLRALAVAQAAGPQVDVQRGQVVNLGHGRGPIALQVAHASLDARLLLGPTHHAKQRRKCVVAGQGLVALVDLPLTAREQAGRHGLGIVPPHFARHATEEREGLDQAVQDRLGALAGQGEHKRTIGVRPGDHQHRHQAAALGKAHMDVPEVGLQALARIVVERDEGLALAALLVAEVQAHALIAAGVVVLGLQAAKDLGGGVSLLGRGIGVGLHQGVDHRLERVEHRGQIAALIRLGFGLGKDRANLPARVMKAPRQFADAQVFHPMGVSHTCIFVHADHPPPPCSWTPSRCTSIQEVAEGGPVFDEDFFVGWARIRRGLPDGAFCHFAKSSPVPRRWQRQGPKILA